MLCGLALIGSFVGVVLWFAEVDFYHLHFFDTGAIVVADNLVRILFTALLFWLIYAPGAAIADVIMAPGERIGLTAAEYAVLGFGIGVGIWHVAMVILGVLDLYSRPLMIGLCLFVLVASTPRFAQAAASGCGLLAGRFARLRRRRISPQLIGAALVAIAAAWLLLLRGLYPGGGGDYYSHYFHYYMAVLKNHGLAPNEVWYHYYYSKGSGLAFLAMLLTDPEAPALPTFCCVIVAAMAMAALAERLVPGSLWPSAAAFTYLLYYLISRIQNGENAFQKDHEEAAALVLLTVWALCMERRGPSRPFLVMAAASATAAAIVTQPVGIVLALFVGFLCGWYALHRLWGDVWRSGCVAAVAASAVLAMFALSYWATGMASDQPLGLMLSFADFSRLDRWGVVPQLIGIAWVRDNYRAVAPPFGMATLAQVSEFARLGFLWPCLAAAAVATAVFAKTRAITGGGLTGANASTASFAKATVTRLATLVALFAAIGVVMGHTQSISFARLSTFFVPLIVLLATGVIGWVLNWPLAHYDQILLRMMLPCLMIIGILVSWQHSEHWIRPSLSATANAFRFFTGRFSLAEGYKHTDSNRSFGAINPGDLAAARQLPPGTPIWSMNPGAYCMVPGCLIEGVFSFKMSGRLDEILGGDPELAKQRLQEAGLNYFLFTKADWLLDLLPYSRLFAPETIGRYLGVKWTDGSSFLLTWIGPGTAPIGSDFLDAYRRARAAPDPNNWFRFKQLAPLIAAIAPRLRSVAEWGTAGRLLTWRDPPVAMP